MPKEIISMKKAQKPIWNIDSPLPRVYNKKDILIKREVLL